MVVREYELNLSATEFLYFLDCPQKFRLYRILNPLPDKENFLSSRRSLSSYKMRGYQGKKGDGIDYHNFFETFHRKYANVITQTIPPDEVCKDNVKLLYWTEQQKDYFKGKENCYWYPVDNEVRLMSEKKRGQIDCIELCEKKNGFRIIDYKSTPDPNDHLLLLFYASLFNEYRLENKDEGEYDFDVLEVGYYYYEMGIRKVYNLKEANSLAFERIFANSLEKILDNEFFLDKSSCWGCNFIRICKIEKSRAYKS